MHLSIMDKQLSLLDELTANHPLVIRLCFAQLNLYGFRRISEGQEKGGYFHVDFTKGKRSRISRIKRKSTATGVGRHPQAAAAAMAYANMSRFGAAVPQAFNNHAFAPTAMPPVSAVGGSDSMSDLLNITSSAAFDDMSRELLLARLANQQQAMMAANYHQAFGAPAASFALGAAGDPLLELVRKGLLGGGNTLSAAAASTSGGSSNHREILNRAAAALYLKNNAAGRGSF